MTCKKCKNTVVCAPERDESGIWSARCPICGNYNYKFGEHHQSDDLSEEDQTVEKVCMNCGDSFTVKIKSQGRIRCDECNRSIQSERNKARWRLVLKERKSNSSWSGHSRPFKSPVA